MRAESFRGLSLVALLGAPAQAYWRMSCSLVQTGRIDPVVSFGAVAGHVHKISGANNIGLSSTFETLQNSRCTSCEVQKDLSAYWTPQLYYQHANGSFEEVPGGGTTVYYLDRGDNKANIQPFPPGLKMLSGNTNLRSFNSTPPYAGARPISDRVSFACLSSKGGQPETPHLADTDCDDGLRAQVHFQSCWDGKNLYLPDNSHVEYMSGLDNGKCPPTHPVQLIHLFFEVMYGVNDIKKDGGQFVFSNGDTTGYGFHGDFINAWDNQTLVNGIAQCMNTDKVTAPGNCPAFQGMLDPNTRQNCAEQPPIVVEQVHGMLGTSLPGCNPVTSGPAPATPGTCTSNAVPSVVPQSTAAPQPMYNPAPGATLSVNGSTWTYLGCAPEPHNGRALTDASTTGDSMTIEMCLSYCKSKGLPLAGVEWQTQCFCGSALTSTSLSDAATCASTPKIVCGGNTTEWCGGSALLTVWNNTQWVDAHPVMAVSTAGTASGKAVFAGCYSEATKGRALSSLSTSGANNTVMTNDLCVGFCVANGYALAGTEYSQECYCGNSLAAGSVILPVTDCKMQCKGDTSSFCGGPSRLSLWNATAYVAGSAGGSKVMTSAGASASMSASISASVSASLFSSLSSSLSASLASSFSSVAAASATSCGTQK